MATLAPKMTHLSLDYQNYAAKTEPLNNTISNNDMHRLS